MDTLDLFIEDFNYFYWDCDRYAEILIADINKEISNDFELLLDYYENHDKFFTEEEKEEIYEVIKQKILMKVNEQLKPFILLKK